MKKFEFVRDFGIIFVSLVSNTENGLQTENNYDEDWLENLYHFNVRFPEELFHEFEKIYFLKMPNGRPRWLKERMMQFKEPIVVNEFYRVIPGFTELAINESGHVVNILRPTARTRYCELDGYPAVELWTQNKSQVLKIHRLLALAWIFNSDPKTKIIINHIDGNKKNYSLTNLEWTTYKENAIHAFQNNLRNDNIPCKIRNIKTKEIIRFTSIGEAFRYMGVKSNIRYSSLLERKREHLFYKELFEFKLENDNTKWRDEKSNSVSTKRSRYVITVITPDGTEEIIHGVVELVKKYKLWNINNNILDLVKAFQEKYLDHAITYRDCYITTAVEALCLQTREIIKAVSIRGIMSKYEFAFWSSTWGFAITIRQSL